MNKKTNRKGKPMDKITIGEVAAAVALLIALIGGGIKIKQWIQEGIRATLKDELGALKKDIESLQTELRKEDKEKTKNYLVACIADIERGQEWTAVERQRFYEQYDHYTIDLEGNTYIKTAVEQYEREHKIWRQE